MKGELALLKNKTINRSITTWMTRGSDGSSARKIGRRNTNTPPQG
ncbi:hypothetical protein EV13_1974 [Prochlorococcus sp. MIT 0702]|nr:hypothetical protein EV13_1974 [Prochlorococcus sp. MIT 0702]KGG28133.1 hypothetical protein EV12_0882 [Prochlorococcus sp. MIT 0701]KGG32788.1 hypothetical protein EV14_1929 [Prochlorococcus sp. MIT 0703]